MLLRYGFSIGSIWTQELEWHIMVPICLFGMSYALRQGEHVRVDVLFQYFSPRNKHLVDVITALLGDDLLSLLVIWLSIPYVWQSWSIGEGTANPGGIDYRYIVKALIPIGFAMFFAAVAVRGDQELPRLPERLMHVDGNPRRPDAGVVLRPADGRHSGRA